MKREIVKMRKLHELMEMALEGYNPMCYESRAIYFCDCLTHLKRKDIISEDELVFAHRYIDKLINYEFSLSNLLFNRDGPDNCTLEQQIQMVMFWINEIEILKEKNL